MCGFTVCLRDPRSSCLGQVNNHTAAQAGALPKESIVKQLQASIALLNHRGPDESGIWVNDDASVALGHCRLAINDLSPSGRQPLSSDDGYIQAVVNGEIYDQDRLREFCSAEHGYKFCSESDSELVVALYKIYGSPGLFLHLRGEFAFVLYDQRPGQQRVVAARDRFGIKPLVWTTIDDRVLLASEAKAFLPLGWKPEWDVEAIATSAWQLDHRTLFKGVHKLLPGHWLEIKDARVEQFRYWDAEYEDKRKVEVRPLDEIVDRVREKLVESVQLRLRADVPVGIYLSGGIDSSAIAGIVTKLAKEKQVKIGSQSSPKITCFSVQFPAESGFDESGIAERTADWLGLEVIKKQVDEEMLADCFADTVYHCEHHHFDLNAVAKFALSTLPRAHGIKVVLTGEGSDEHFAGYPYFPADYLRESDYAQPDSLLAKEGGLRDRLREAVDVDMKNIFTRLGSTDHGVYPDRMEIADVNNSSIPETLVIWHASRLLFAPWVKEKTEGLDHRLTVLKSLPLDARVKMRSRWHPLHSALYMWNKTTLANVLLSCLGDRTEMAHSIEARTPFLDHHLTEYVNRLPPSMKIALCRSETEASRGQRQEGDQGPLWKSSMQGLQSLTEKWILREAAKPFITDELYKRRKHPFLAPMKWPRNGPLHRLLESLLTPEAVANLGFLDFDVVANALRHAFGDSADGNAFRTLLYVASWVVLSRRFGVKTAEPQDWLST